MPSFFETAPDHNGKTITVSHADTEEPIDPVIAQFLALLERDLVMGKNVTAFPATLNSSLKQALKHPVDLSEDIKGDVNL